MKYKLSDLIPIINETLESGKEFTLPVTGTSMLPLLVEKRDSIVLKKAVPPLQKGDLPLYRRTDGSFVLHRVVSAKNGKYIMSGDNQFIPEYDISDDMIIGVVSKIIRNGKEVDVNSLLYRLYVYVWTALFKVRYPIRRIKSSAVKTDEVLNHKKTPQKSVHAEYLITLLRCALLEEDVPPVPSGVDMEKVFRLANAHKIANLAAYSVMRLDGADKEILKKFKTELFKVAQREVSQEVELKKIEKCFDKEKIEYSVLKGKEIAKFYPSTDMRFSLDMDIYISRENADKAAEIMLSLGYEQQGVKGAKDMAFVKKPNLTAEIHFELNYESDRTYDYFKKLPQRLVKVDGSANRLKMTDEDLFIYVTGHAAHHFLVAGTGIKSIIDDFILRKELLPFCDMHYIEKELKSAGIFEFSQNIKALGDFWFGDGKKTEFMEELELYIFKSGVFGTDELYYVNAMSPQRKKDGSRFLYIIERMFLPYTSMTYLYPILKKAPFLLPLFWVVRLFKVFKNTKDVSTEVAKIRNVSDSEVEQRNNFFEKMGFL
ncbi:MAG TPA: nucleotidyltransferase family protein [Oscillospiraceae bacterium]|nr:nucleotidyltransferase family protein [Oscillospiraceae bacterium]